jgi:mRNA interferase RelE/StbE
LAWQIRITRTAEKQIKALDKTVQMRVVKSLKEIMDAANPRVAGKELKGNKAKLWRYRVGDYRIICKIDDIEKKLSVLEVAHRIEVYR